MSATTRDELAIEVVQLLVLLDAVAVEVEEAEGRPLGGRVEPRVLQHHGAVGARGNQKLEMGPFGHGPLSGGLEYPNGGGIGNAQGGADS